MPESIKILGVLTVPADNITSFLAKTVLTDPSYLNSTPVATPFSIII